MSEPHLVSPNTPVKKTRLDISENKFKKNSDRRAYIVVKDGSKLDEKEVKPFLNKTKHALPQKNPLYIYIYSGDGLHDGGGVRVQAAGGGDRLRQSGRDPKIAGGEDTQEGA